jgi:ketosteroid isomerase-like protein
MTSNFPRLGTIRASLFALAACLLLGPAGQAAGARTGAAPTGRASDRAAREIRAVLDAQVAAWNAGRLEEFMAGYWRSPRLTFFSGGNRQQGWDATLARYRQTYQGEGREMGRLAFSDLDIQPLGGNAAVVRGRWGLTLADGKRPGGLFTLVFRRFKDGWKITHDHTSASQ